MKLSWAICFTIGLRSILSVSCVVVYQVRFIATKNGRTDYALAGESIELSCHYMMKDEAEDVKHLVWSKDGKNVSRSTIISSQQPDSLKTMPHTKLNKRKSVTHQESKHLTRSFQYEHSSSNGARINLDLMFSITHLRVT